MFHNLNSTRFGSIPCHIGDAAPDFTAETTEGTIHFYDWIGDGWVVLAGLHH
jgi:alkyl hydroperoxide reductase subunit AhpC